MKQHVIKNKVAWWSLPLFNAIFCLHCLMTQLNGKKILENFMYFTYNKGYHFTNNEQVSIMWLIIPLWYVMVATLQIQ